MANALQISAAYPKDLMAWNLLVNYQAGYSSSSPIRYATQCLLTSGEAPSYAYTAWPVMNHPADELAPNLALRGAGWAGKIPLRTRCQVMFNNNGTTIPVLCGTLAEYTHDFGDDSVIPMIVGDALLLQKVTVLGRMVYDPSVSATAGTGMTYFDTERPTIFNEGGWPDCLDNPSDGQPYFAPSWRFGYKNEYDKEDYDEPAVGQATTRARSWTAQDALNYLRNFCYINEGVNRPMIQSNLGITLSKWIKWPANASNVVGNLRVLRHVNVQNLTLARALTTVVRRAGAYDIFFKPGPGYQSTLTFINQMPGTGGNGSILQLPGYQSTDIGFLVQNADTIRTGYVKESIFDYFDGTAIVGDPPACESLVSVSSGGGSSRTPALTQGQNLLEFAWDFNDQVDFNQYLSDNGNDQTAFMAATKIWPLVYCAYRIKGGGKIFDGTKWEQIGMVGPFPKIRPFLLTGNNQNSGNPRDWAPRDIVVEIGAAVPNTTPGPKDPNSGQPTKITEGMTNSTTETGTWVSAGRQDGLQISPDGQMILLPALRDQFLTFGFSNSTRGQFEGDAIYPNLIRLTVAVTGDQRIVGTANNDPNNTAPRVSSGEDYPWIYTAVADPDDYVDFLRQGSYPAGTDAATLTPPQTWADHCTTGDELFTDIGDNSHPDYTKRIWRHALVRNNDFKRVDNPGQVVMCSYDPSIIPGLPVNIFGGGFGIQTYSVIKSVNINVEQQACTIDLGSPDTATIYDQPAQGTKPPNMGNPNAPIRHPYQYQTVDNNGTYIPPKEVPTAIKETSRPHTAATQEKELLSRLAQSLTPIESPVVKKSTVKVLKGNEYPMLSKLGRPEVGIKGTDAMADESREIREKYER